MVNYDCAENINKNNSNQPKIPDHPYIINNWRLWIWKNQDGKDKIIIDTF